MLYAIARELETALRAQHVPIPVVFGPEPAESIGTGRERIVFEYAGQGADSIAPPKTQHPNPRMPLIRNQGARVRIFARANVSNATWHEHAERGEQILDHVLAELDAIVRRRKNAITYGSGGFIELLDAEGSLVWSGAVYELDVAIDRGVFRKTWEGDKRPEAVIGGAGGVTLTSTTKVSDDLGPAGTPPLDAETAC